MEWTRKTQLRKTLSSSPKRSYAKARAHSGDPNPRKTSKRRLVQEATCRQKSAAMYLHSDETLTTANYGTSYAPNNASVMVVQESRNSDGPSPWNPSSDFASNVAPSENVRYFHLCLAQSQRPSTFPFLNEATWNLNISHRHVNLETLPPRN